MFSFLTTWELRKQLKLAMETKRIVAIGAAKNEDFLARITHLGWATYSFVAVADDELTWQGEYTYPLSALLWLSFADQYRDGRRIDREKGIVTPVEEFDEDEFEDWDDDDDEDDDDDGDVYIFNP